jgi:hypothetical protein
MTAIQRAIASYNAAAIQLTPPRQQLTWAQIAENTTIGGFDLLRDTRSDIRQLPWADPARREAMKLYFGIKRAKEEITRLNVEIRRLLTFMKDDHVDYVRAIQQQTSPSTETLSLAHELSTQWRHRSNINENIVERLVKTSRLIGFTGLLIPGDREGREVTTGIALLSWATSTLGLTYVIVEDDGENAGQDLNDIDDDLVESVMDQLYLS